MTKELIRVLEDQATMWREKLDNMLTDFQMTGEKKLFEECLALSRKIDHLRGLIKKAKGEDYL